MIGFLLAVSDPIGGMLPPGVMDLVVPALIVAGLIGWLLLKFGDGLLW